MSVENKHRRDDDIAAAIGPGLVDLARDEPVTSEPWPVFVARLLARYEERQRDEVVAERILALSLDLGP